MEISKTEHKLLALWAADCAEHVLFQFETYYPNDLRPRKAVNAARQWAMDKIKTSKARSQAFSAHAAAREVTKEEAIAAARSAGHAAATAHVPSHAKQAAIYAQKAVREMDNEKKWQLNRLPIEIRHIAAEWLVKI